MDLLFIVPREKIFKINRPKGRENKIMDMLDRGIADVRNHTS